MRVCRKCWQAKPLDSFMPHRECKEGRSFTCRVCSNTALRAKRKSNPEPYKLSKRKYYTSEKGRLQKCKEELAYQANGGRAAAERRRAERGISEARMAARYRYSERYKTLLSECSDFDLFVLEEAKDLSKLREKYFGFKWSIDHIVPIIAGGTHRYDNLQVVPTRWNQQKATKIGLRFLG